MLYMHTGTCILEHSLYNSNSYSSTYSAINGQMHANTGIPNIKFKQPRPETDIIEKKEMVIQTEQNGKEHSMIYARDSLLSIPWQAKLQQADVNLKQHRLNRK